MKNEPAKIRCCRLCTEPANRKRSHILPEFLYQRVYGARHRFLVVPLHRPATLELHEKGLRERLLCGPCEAKMSRWEGYASQVIFHRTNLTVVRQRRRLRAAPVDYGSFKLFLLSMLWKAHESSLPTFDEVDLGADAEVIRLMLLESSPGDPFAYPCLMSVFTTHRDDFKRTIVPPHRMSAVRGFPVYRMAFAGFRFDYLIARDEHPFRVPEMFIDERNVLPVHLVSPEKSDDYYRSIAASIPDPGPDAKDDD